MGKGSQLPGPDESTRVTVRVHESDVEQWDEFVEASDQFDSRSEALRAAMQRLCGGAPESDTPRVPPKEPRLSRGYRLLCEIANLDGWIRHNHAERVISGGPENLAKEDVIPLVMQPLRERGYLRRMGTVYDRDASDARWKIRGWDQ